MQAELNDKNRVVIIRIRGDIFKLPYQSRRRLLTNSQRRSGSKIFSKSGRLNKGHLNKFSLLN